MCAFLLSCVRPFATPWTVAHRAPLSMGFLRQESWSGLPFPPPGDLTNPGNKPLSLLYPALAGRFFTSSTTWKAQIWESLWIDDELAGVSFYQFLWDSWIPLMILLDCVKLSLQPLRLEDFYQGMVNNSVSSLQTLTVLTCSIKSLAFLPSVVGPVTQDMLWDWSHAYSSNTAWFWMNQFVSWFLVCKTDIIIIISCVMVRVT